MIRRLTLFSLLAALLLVTACSSQSNEGGNAGSNAAPAPSSEASGNASETPAGTSGADFSEPVTLKLLFYTGQSQRLAEIAGKELKELVKKEINAQLDLTYLPWSEYGGGKTDLMLSSGEEFAAYTDINYLSKSVSKGLYADLTPYVDDYAPDLKSNVAAASFDAFKMNGKQYAIPVGNRASSAAFYSVMVRQDLLEEVGMSSVGSLAELEEYYDKVHAKHPDMIGFASADATYMLMYEYTDMNLNWINNFIAVNEAAEDDKLISWYESPEFKAYASLMNGWYKKGIIPKYAATNQPQLLSDWNVGKAMFYPGTATRPIEGIASITQAVPTAKLQNYFLNKNDRPKISRGTYNTAYFVSANAKHPERYVAFFNLLQKNQELYDFFTYGIKDKDYTIDEKGRIANLTSDLFFDDWMMMNDKFMRFETNVSDDFIEEYKHWDDDAILSKTAGFNFDNTKVKNEEAKLNGVYTEFVAPISSGFVDYDTYFPKTLEKLKAAGLDAYIAEYQRQFSEWSAGRPQS
ncbi:DUF3502 domain-containing protein [Cohnella fermenti]|uniref:DUF3502 domain-containing protein n=1 Tax=Cohnella fermenti TaxID=2565925 RepID=A0A4S4BRW2_9BACL|nr:DUF3502 domain-containing protein [Cohnella fermenti]THF77764.1 DUF3502 domain-containing protein [Cohnella fermenti]